MNPFSSFLGTRHQLMNCSAPHNSQSHFPFLKLSPVKAGAVKFLLRVSVRQHYSYLYFIDAALKHTGRRWAEKFFFMITMTPRIRVDQPCAGLLDSDFQELQQQTLRLLFTIGSPPVILIRLPSLTLSKAPKVFLKMYLRQVKMDQFYSKALRIKLYFDELEN